MLGGSLLHARGMQLVNVHIAPQLRDYTTQGGSQGGGDLVVNRMGLLR